MAVIDSTGARVKTLNEYLDDIRAKYLAIDSAWNINTESPDGNAIEIWSELMANLDEAIIAAYQATDPQTAIDSQLDRIGEFSGITRQTATASTATVTFTGTDGTTIPQGTEVRNAETDTIWTTDTAVTIASTTVTASVTCQDLGPETAAIGDLSVIATPVAGLSSVTNTQAASLGREKETNAAFRARRARSVSAPGTNQVDSIVGRVADVEGVKHVRVYENVTATADANGLDPHSMAIFVDGGAVEDVAGAIARKKSPGVGFNATNTYPNKVQVSTETEQLSPLDVTFYRPELSTIYVFVTVEGNISSATVDMIKEFIVEYSNGELFGDGSIGFDRVGFGIGQTLNAGKLFTPVNKAVSDSGAAQSIEISTDPNLINQQSVDPGFNGLVVLNKDNITVVTV